MNWYYIGAGTICILIGLQFALADMISTSISCDGAALLSGSFIGLNQSYSQHLFTDDRAVLSRDLTFTGPVKSSLMVNSSGSIGYDEYAENSRIPDVSSFLCSFMGVKNEERRSEELVTFGLMQNGLIISVKQVGEEGTRSRTLINGTDQVSLSTETRNNYTSKTADLCRRSDSSL
ncbi:hypothetical protein [uncultured Methanospirillum sp.]|uniref:hypothetical protein n=2 Tax=uncultured Methanospirillum sp. TaxID=262503 RepID=UPI0029C8A992|nr:hypothetical protein [uncultured Methanospirillum sp.]